MNAGLVNAGPANVNYTLTSSYPASISYNATDVLR